MNLLGWLKYFKKPERRVITEVKTEVVYKERFSNVDLIEIFKNASQEEIEYVATRIELSKKK